MMIIIIIKYDMIKLANCLYNLSEKSRINIQKHKQIIKSETGENPFQEFRWSEE